MVASRRYHVAVADSAGRILIHGGEDYRHSSIKVGPMKDFAVLTVKNKRTNWYNVSVDGKGTGGLPLSGHTALACDGELFMFGGFGKDWKINKQTYKISLKE